MVALNIRWLKAMLTSKACVCGVYLNLARHDQSFSHALLCLGTGQFTYILPISYTADTPNLGIYMIGSIPKGPVSL